MDRTWLFISRDDLLTERLQAEQEGLDISGFGQEFESLLREEVPDQTRAGALLDGVQSAPVRSDFSFVEPSDLESIRSESKMPPATSVSNDLFELSDKMHGAWLGRCCGCMLGKVAEGWRRPTMEGFLRDTGQWPLSGYISKGASEEVRKKHGVERRGFWIEDHCEMPEDDDLNYTVSGFEILRRHGRDFTPDHVAAFWMSDIPIYHVCTAERVAYKNFVNGFDPPASASFRNPYREWIGAQIRADFWGYCNPGDPRTAAEYAWRDASVSHIKNGIYGEMWAAAMIAHAFVAEGPREAIETGIEAIPRNSRLAASLRKVIRWRDNGKSADEAADLIHSEWDEMRSHDWCHTISNAMIVTMALLWGERNFEKTICLAVKTCFDTDCNGATSGSVLGAMLGASALPKKWTSPLNDTLETGVQGYHRVQIGEMASRTIELLG